MSGIVRFGALALLGIVAFGVALHLLGYPLSDYRPVLKPRRKRPAPRHNITPERENFRADKISVRTVPIDPRVIARVLAEGRHDKDGTP